MGYGVEEIRVSGVGYRVSGEERRLRISWSISGTAWPRISRVNFESSSSDKY